jgi:hypothetical protein
MYYHLPSTGLRTTSADWNKYYHLPSTGLCTTTAEWNKYYHLPSTGLCTTSNGWKLPLDYILIIVSVHVLWRGKHSDHTTPGHGALMTRPWWILTAYSGEIRGQKGLGWLDPDTLLCSLARGNIIEMLETYFLLMFYAKGISLPVAQKNLK